MYISQCLPLCSVNSFCEESQQQHVVYLKWQVRDDARDSKADQQQVGEDEGSGGVDDLLDLLVRAARLTRLPDGTGILDVLYHSISLQIHWFCVHSDLLAVLSLSSSQSLSLQSMT